jgi:hypothetical protein
MRGFSFPMLESSQSKKIHATFRGRGEPCVPRRTGPDSMKFFLFLVSDVIGFLAGHYLFHGANAYYASTLISYHVLLAGLVLIPGIAEWSYGTAGGMEGAALSWFADGFRVSNSRDSRGLSLPIGEAVLTHLACVALMIGLPYMREHIPFFGFVSLLIPGVAFFESQWLFSGGRKKRQEENAPQPISAGTAEDHDAFLQYLAQPHRRFSSPGRSVSEEQALWLTDRMKQRAALEQARCAAGLATE